MTEKTATFDTLDGALGFLSDEHQKTKEQIEKYRHHVKELTGFYPDEKLGPMEVVALFKRVFGGNTGGQPKAD